ncbi:MAG TPA: DUF6510 family protein [Jatrophihabitans sp.]|jgi:hypothetical protein|nr:DUF6510 family protein [Jatrophihabitans sp.]
MTNGHEDGNALAGPLAEVFAVEITGSIAVCGGCRRSDRMAALHVYLGGPGFVARCPSCDTVMLRYAETPHGRWLDLRGTAALHFAPAAPG